MKKRSGIFLISALVTVVVVAMFITAAVALIPGGAAATRNYQDYQAAMAAAESGLAYARAKLQADPAWVGGVDGQVLVVDQAGFTVVEDTGNVVGLITTPDGHVSQFRIRFNYQDGDPGADGRPNPGAPMVIDHRHISVSTLGSSTGATAPEADTLTWSVTDPNTGVDVPALCARVVVEGRAGAGLRNHTSADPNAPLNGPVTTRHVEAYYRESNVGRIDSVLSAGGGIDFTLPGGGVGEVILDSTEVTQGPRVQGLTNVTAVNGDSSEQVVRAQPPDTTTGYSGKGKGKGSSGPPPVTVDPAKVTHGVSQSFTHDALVTTSQEPAPNFLALTWDEIQTADTAGPTIEAGTYVLYGNTLYHYPYDVGQMLDPGVPGDPGSPAVIDPVTGLEITPAVPPTPGVPATYWSPPAAPDGTAEAVLANFSNVGTVSGNDIKWQMRTNWTGGWTGATEHTGVNVMVNEDIYVAPSSTTTAAGTTATGFALMTADPALDSSNVMISFTPKDEVAIMSTTGDFVVEGKVEGSGVAVTAEGDINLNGAGFNLLLEPNAETSLNLYAKGDITINTQKPDGEWGDLSMNGIIYTWGNFTANLGGNTGNGGVFYLTGAMEAYGNDPEVAGGAGAAGGGNVAIDAAETYMNFDSAYLTPILKAREGKLVNLMFNAF